MEMSGKDKTIADTNRVKVDARPVLGDVSPRSHSERNPAKRKTAENQNDA
jgi:hypothetical protein